LAAFHDSFTNQIALELADASEDGHDHLSACVGIAVWIAISAKSTLKYAPLKITTADLVGAVASVNEPNPDSADVNA
jgi:hypothetical protein